MKCCRRDEASLSGLLKRCKRRTKAPRLRELKCRDGELKHRDGESSSVATARAQPSRLRAQASSVATARAQVSRRRELKRRDGELKRHDGELKRRDGDLGFLHFESPDLFISDGELYRRRMDSRQYSSFTDVLRGNINGEDELFGLSENNPLLVQDSPTDDEVATSKKKSTRGVAFSPEEDKLVVAAWLNTSVDPVHSNEQHKTTFYDKVAKYFKDHKTDSTRSISSLTSRW
nr:hypothetical protein CFP56_23490 [Quercus suber]